MNLWDEILEKVESKVNRHSFNTWFRPTRLLFTTANTLAIQVPNAHFRDWLNKHYSWVIHESLDELNHSELEVVFETQPPPASEPSTTDTPSSSEPLIQGAILNPKYTFDSFVVGTSNQFAHAAARAVAESVEALR
ncbi:MAG: DnaA N-terminal domain-containing protein [Acidobacteriota bacterium]